jgi:hypothetical protein
MRAFSIYATAVVVTAATLALERGAHAQDSKRRADIIRHFSRQRRRPRLRADKRREANVTIAPRRSHKRDGGLHSPYAAAIVMAAMLAPASGAYAQDTKLPNVTVTVPAAPVEPPYMRDPWKAYGRNPYEGRYRVEEDKLVEVPRTATRIALAASGKCLQGYRLRIPNAGRAFGRNPCELGLDVVIDTAGKLAIEADILAFDPYPYKAFALNREGGSPPRWCYVHGYTGYDQEDFQDMNQVTRRGTNWHNLQINDTQDQWYGGDRLRSIEFSDGPHNCIAVRKAGPVWRGGFVYMMHVSICRIDTAAVQAQDIAYVFGSLQTRFHDPIGNLRKAGDRTTSGPAANSR